MGKAAKTWDDVAAHIGMPTRDVHRWRKIPGSPVDKNLAAWSAFAATRKRKINTDLQLSDQGANGEASKNNPIQESIGRIRLAEARLKEANARRAEIANEIAARDLVPREDGERVLDAVAAAVRIEADSLVAYIDLMGLSPEVAGPLRAAAVQLARRFRSRIAAIPELGDPAITGEAS